MNRASIMIVPPELIDQAWPRLTPLADILFRGENPPKEFLYGRFAGGKEELHVVLDSTQTPVAFFSVSHTSDLGLRISHLACVNQPLWMGYILRNAYELMASRGLRYLVIKNQEAARVHVQS